jgi:hypothetical protein
MSDINSTTVTMTAKEAKAEAKAAKARAKSLKPWFKKPTRVLPLAFVAVIGLSMAANAGGGEVPSDTVTSTSASVSEEKVVVEEPKSDITPAQENALESAESYLDYSAFSKVGLVNQLTSSIEGYDKADAKWAVAQLDVNWNEQAARSAESYLEYSSFSRDGMINQLTASIEGYTKAQATYAVDTLGL